MIFAILLAVLYLGQIASRKQEFRPKWEAPK